MRQAVKHWKDRIGRMDDGRYMFRCKRSPHGEITRSFGSRIEAERFRGRHDEQHHGERPAVAQTRSATIRTAAYAIIAHIEALTVIGKKDTKTVKEYRDITRRLEGIFGPGRTLETIDLESAREYVRRRLSGAIAYNGRQVRTKGARVLKELKFLERMARENGVTFPWSSKKHFEEDLKTSADASTPRRGAVGLAQVRTFIDNLQGAAKAFVITKAFTVMRNEELYNLRVGDVDLVTGQIHYIARAKRKRIQTVAELVPEIKEAIRPLMVGRSPEEWLFTCEGRKVQQSSFRKQFMKASKAAGLSATLGLETNKQAGGVAWVRHAIMTALRPFVGIDVVSKFANHSSVAVTEEVYDLDKEARGAKALAAAKTRTLLAAPPGSSEGANPNETPTHSGPSVTPSDPLPRSVTAGFSRLRRLNKARAGQH